MHVVVTCTQCSRQLRLPQEVIGSTVRCPLCQAVFLTRATGDGNAEALPVAAPKPAPPAAPPRGVPNLSLEDESDLVPLPKSPDVPVARLDDDDPNRPLAPIPLADEPLDALPARPRRGRDRERERARRRDEDDDEEEDEEEEPREPRRRPRKRRPIGPDFPAIPFAVLAQNDPRGKIEGRFHAEIDHEGLRLWRGKGRTLHVEPGDPVEYLDGARLRAEVEGRQVELTVIQDDGHSLLLAQSMAEFFQGERETISLPAQRNPWPLTCLVGLPVLIPILALAFGHSLAGVVGGVLFFLLAALLAGVAALVVFRTSWSHLSRFLTAGSAVLLGYLIVGCGLLIDRSVGGSDVPSSAWQTFTPREGGYTVSMPGTPRPRLWTSNDLRGGGMRVYESQVERAGLVFQAGMGQFTPQSIQNVAAGLPRLTLARNVIHANNPNSIAPGVGFQVNTEPGTFGHDFPINLPNERHMIARIVERNRRFWILTVAGNSVLTPTSPEVRKFFDSFKKEDSKEPDEPEPRADAGKRPVPGPGPVPPANEDLGANGKLLVLDSTFAWAGYAADGRTIVGVTVGGKVFVWDEGGQPRTSIKSPVTGVVSAALSPDGGILVEATTKGLLSLTDLTTQASSPLPGGPLSRLWAIAYSPDGSTLAAAEGNGKVHLYDMAGRKRKSTLSAGPTRVSALAWSPDSKLLAAASVNGTIRVYDPAAPDKPLATWTAPAAAGAPRGGIRTTQRVIRSLAFARDNTTLASAGNDGTARVWDAITGNQKVEIRPGAPVTAVAFHPPGRLLATGTSDGKVQLWETATGRRRGEVRVRFGVVPTKGIVRSLSFSRDDRYLVVAIGDRVERWNVEGQVGLQIEDRTPLQPQPRNRNQLSLQVDGRPAVPRWLAVGKDGTRFAVTPTSSGETRIYETATFKPDGGGTLNGQTCPPAFAPDGSLLALGSATQIILVDPATGRSLGSLPAPAFQQVQALAFSADGKTLVSGHARLFGVDPGELCVWDVPGRRLLRKFRGNPFGTHAVALSPDGLTLAAGGHRDQRVRLFDLATGREYAGLVGHSGSGVQMLAYSPDGKTLASAGRDRTARLWSTTRCREALKLEGHRGVVNAVAFSPDGKTLATGGADQSAKLWDAASGKPLHSLSQGGAVVGVGFGPGGKVLLVASADGAVTRWDLGAVPQLGKRPEPVEPALDRSPAPEVPDLQVSGRVVPHLASVVDPKAGYLLAFTRDRLCLHYRYPDLTLQGVRWTGALVHKAVLDPARGIVYAAVADPRSFKLQPGGSDGWAGKGPIHVYDVKSLLAGKDATEPVKPSAVIDIKGTLAGLYLSGDGRSLCYFDVGDFLKRVIGRIDTSNNQVAEPLVLEDRPLIVRMAPNGKTLYAACQKKRPGMGNAVVPVDVATLKPGKTVDLAVFPSQLEAGDEYLAVVGGGVGGQQGITFLERTKDDLPVEMRWVPLFGLPAVRITGGRVYAQARFGGARLEVYSLTPKVNGRVPVLHARLDSSPDVPLEGDFSPTPDGKYLLFGSGVLLRIRGGDLVLPKALGKTEEAPAGKLKRLGTWKEGPGLRVLALGFSPDGRKLLTAGDDRQTLLDLGAEGNTTVAMRRQTGAYAVAWARSGKHWGAATWGGTLSIFATPDNREVGRPGGIAPAGVDTVAFSPDGTQVVAAGVKGLNISPIAAFNVAGRAITSAEPLTGVAVAPGNGLVCAGGTDGLVRLFDLTGDKEKVTLKGHTGEVRCVAISPDGKVAVSGGIDGKVKVWDVAEGKERHSLQGHRGVVLSVALAPDGKRIASGGLDGSVRLWDAGTGKELVVEPGRAMAPIYALAFRADGKTLAVAAGGEVVRHDTSTLVGEANKGEP